MRHTIITLLALTITLAACTPATALSPTATAVPTVTSAPTATNAPSPTPTVAAAPTMESLPAEWQGKIDRIETMTNMDGKTTRVVAVESLTDEDKAAGKTEAKLRVLQWDGKEWVSYVPQVGLISVNPQDWDIQVNGVSLTSDEKSPQELQSIVAEPIYGKNGQEIRPGLVVDFKDGTLLCVDVIEKINLSDGYMFVMKFPDLNGDIQLIEMGGGGIKDGSPDFKFNVYDQNSIDPSKYTRQLTSGDMHLSQALSVVGLIDYRQFSQYTAQIKVPQRMLVVIDKRDSSLMLNDSSKSRNSFLVQYLEGDAFNLNGVGVIMNQYPIMDEQTFKFLQMNK